VTLIVLRAWAAFLVGVTPSLGHSGVTLTVLRAWTAFLVCATPTLGHSGVTLNVLATLLHLLLILAFPRFHPTALTAG